MVHWFTQQERGGGKVERAALADYALSVMWVDGAAYWLVARDGRDVAEGKTSTLDRARRDAEREANIAARVRRLPTPEPCMPQTYGADRACLKFR